MNDVPLRLDGASETANHECSDEAALAKKVSVSVADAGETALVVSMVESKQSEVLDENVASALEIKEDEKAEKSLAHTSGDSLTLETGFWLNAHPDIGPLETSLALSSSRDRPVISMLKVKCEPDCSDGGKLSPDKTFNGSEPSECESNIDLHLGLSLWSSLSGSYLIQRLLCVLL